MTARERWTGRAGLTLATVGSAVGLGSIWKFPYEVGANGGSGFIFFYLAGLVLIVVPLMLAEFALGRRGGGDPASSIAAVARTHGCSTRWQWVGVLGVVTGFLILSFYAVIGGWTIAYGVDAVAHGLPRTAEAVRARYHAFLGAPLPMVGFHALFMAITVAIVARGVVGGIEAAAKVLMPILVVLIVLLATYSLAVGDAGAAITFLFKLDPERLTARAALEAVGLGFFSIGVGLGLMITYGAYSGAEISLKEVAVISVVADTAISFLAGFAVFPIVFAHGLDPGSGPGLVFVTLPLAFAAVPFGAIAAAAFFVLLFVAALASALSMLELVVALLMLRVGLSRTTASVASGIACFALGLATVFSFNVWADWFPLAAWPGFARATVYDVLDHVTSNVLLPLGGLLLSLLAGWALPVGPLLEELRLGPRGARILRRALRYVVPAAIGMTVLAPLVL